MEGAGGSWQAVPIDAKGPQGEELTIDVGMVGSNSPERTVVVSSGLHGVEGFMGSAIQVARLETRRGELPAATRLVLVHSINPFGFAWLRRWNEDNIDLNRNFLASPEDFAGSPPLYVDLDGLLNPRTPPSRWEPLALKALGAMLRYGASNLARTLPVGQYEFPQGLFYGGSGPAQSRALIEQHFAGWLTDAREIWHIDLHSGLGDFGKCQLMVDASPSDERVARLAARFGSQLIAPNRLSSGEHLASGGRQPPGSVSASGGRKPPGSDLANGGREPPGSIADRASTSRLTPAVRQTDGPGRLGLLYASRGTWEHWCQARFSDRQYNYVAAEFGTYSGRRVIAALRAENRAWHYAPRNDPAYAWTRAAVLEAFAPRSPRWREEVVRQGLELIDRALAR
jgi:hypothetical protein